MAKQLRDEFISSSQQKQSLKGYIAVFRSFSGLTKMFDSLGEMVCAGKRLDPNSPCGVTE
jgi:hypothetical protein